ncbi:MAG: PAS domain S-box protein [Chloroflexota bacterium]
MKVTEISSVELVRELNALRQRVAELEQVAANRKRTERELQKLSSAIEQTADLVMITDKEGVLEYVNPAFEALSGYSKDEVLGRQANVVNSNQHTPDFYQEMWQTILAGQVFHSILVNRKKNGELYFEEKTISPVRDEQGQITHFISTGRDVTALKEAEAERARFTNQLRTAADVSNQLSAILDIEELLGKVVSLLRSRFDLYHVHVYLLNPAGNDLIMAVGSGEIGQELRERSHHIPLHREHSLVARAARTGQVALAGDVGLEPDFMANPLLPATRSEVAIPLIAADRVIGVLDLQDDQFHRFNPSELDTFSALAGHIATALQNARLFEEQKRAEESLRESELRFREVFENVSDGLYLLEVTEDGRFRNIEVNPAFEKSVGIPPALLIGKYVEETVPEETAQRTLAKYRGCVEAGALVDYEVELELPTGLRLFHSTLIPLRDETGRIYRIVGISRDITERKRAEEALTDAHLRLEQALRFTEALLSAIPTPVFYKDREGRYLGCNRAFSEIMGVTPAEIKGKTVFELWPSDHAAIYHDKDLELMSHPGRQVYEFMVWDKDGLERPVIYVKDVFRDENDQAAGIVGAFLDITERKQAEQRLTLLNFALNNVRDEAYLINEQACFDYVNDEACRALEYSREELLGINVADIDPDFPLERWPEHWRDLKAHGSLTFEGHHRARDGRIYPVEISANYFEYDGHGYNLALVRDITERKRDENIMQARLRLLEFANLHSLDELLTATLDEIEALTGSTVGFYHFLEPDQKTLSLQSWSTNTLKNMCRTEGKGVHYDVAQAGVWADCVHQRRPVIHNDYAALPYRKGMPKGHTPVTREVVVPIFRGNLIEAIIGVGNKATNYNENDIEIVSQLGDLSWDIAERKRAEEALKDQYSTLRGIIDSANALIFSVDRQYRYTSFNQGHAAAMKALYGAEIETGHTLLDYMTVPEDRETARRNFDRALAGEQLVEESYSGEELRSRQYFQVSHSPIKTESGEVIGVAVLAQDLTERKQAEEALRKSEERFRTVADFTYDWEYWIGPDGNYLYVSPSCQRVTGYSAEEFIKDPQLLERITHANDRQLVAAHAESESQERGVASLDFRIISRRGEERWLNHVCHPVFADDGRWLGRRASNRDITQRKQTEEELRRLNQDLDAFARTTAHDLQNPLSLILNYAQLLKEEARLPENHDQYLSALLRNAHKMGSIIDELLLLAGVRKANVDIKPLNMGRIVGEAQQRLIHMIREYQAELILPPGWPEALGYAPWIEQVWANYISNAIKYGGKPPRLQLGATERSDGLVRFWIRDNGPGLTAEEQTRLFVPFIRLDQVRATGHGLGLSIVHRIVTRLGGEVGVESEGVPGKGSIFFFTLPGRRKQ